MMTEANELLKQIQEAARNRDGDPKTTGVE